MHRTFRWTLRLIGALLCATAGLGHAAPCLDRIQSQSPVLSNGFAQSLENRRHNPSAITASNVTQLELALSHVAVGSREKRGAPAVTEQAVFLAAGPEIIAINRVSGCTYWSYRLPHQFAPTMFKYVMRASAVYYIGPRGKKPAVIIAGDSRGMLHALDAVSGRLRWARFVGSDPRHHFITGAPQFFDGKLIVPVSSREVLTAFTQRPEDCCRSHGMVVALNPYNGKLLWRYDTTPPAVRQPGSQNYGPNGAAVWGTPAIDRQRRLVYFGTGQNLTPPTTETSDAVIALDFDTGKRRWIFQATSGDAYNVACAFGFPLNQNCAQPAGPDYDFGAPPMLVDLPQGGQALIVGDKKGVAYSLNPDSGMLNWAEPLGTGGTLGGIHWGMAADSQRVYVAISDATVNKVSAVTVGIFSPVEPVPGARPGVYALRLQDGARVWEVHPQHSIAGAQYASLYSAALSVTNDVVFAGSLNGVLKAFRSSDGEELWSYDSATGYTDVDGNPGNGGTIDSVGAIAAGRDLLLNSGYDTFGNRNEYQAGPGNVLLIFRLPSSS